MTTGEPLYKLTEEDKVNMADIILSSMLTGPPTSVAKVRIDSAVKPQWLNEYGGLTGKSTVNATYQIKIPKGTTIYYGPVGPQGGVYLGEPDNIQIFIDQPWKIPGLEVIKETPLK